MRMLPRCNQEWIENLRGQLKIIIVSNGYDRDIKNYFEERGIDVINWFIVGLIVWTLSALCAFGGLFLLFWSIGRLPS